MATTPGTAPASTAAPSRASSALRVLTAGCACRQAHGRFPVRVKAVACTMPGYHTKHEQIAVTGVNDLCIRSLLDRQQYADPNGDAERLGISSAAWPLFGLLWPSGALLAARLARRPVRAQERILEGGCGLALASLVGHWHGADATASDCHPLAEGFLLENLRLNDLAPMKYRHGQWGAHATPHW